MRILIFLKSHPVVQFAFFGLLTVIVFLLLFLFINPGTVYVTFIHANPTYLFYALLITGIHPTSIAWRWQYLLRMMGYNIPFWRCLKIVLGTWPIMSITPLKSGDLLKGLYLKDSVPSTKAVGSVMTEKILDVSSLLLLSIVGSLFLQQITTLFLSLGALVVLVVGVMLVGFTNLPIRQSWKEKVNLLFTSVKTLTGQPKDLLVMLSFSVLKWFFVVLQVELCFAAFDIHVQLIYVAAALPIAIFVGLLPISIGGMGTRDGALIYLFSSFASPEVCLSVGILYSVFGYWLVSLIGLPFLRLGLSSYSDFPA